MLFVILHYTVYTCNCLALKRNNKKKLCGVFFLLLLTNIRGYLGLEALHAITNERSYQLQVDLEDWDGNTYYADYRYGLLQG